MAIIVAMEAVEVPMASHWESLFASAFGFVGTMTSEPGVGFSPLPI